MNTKPNTVRVRFAPSPTGYLHLGGLRVALFNWLFARHNNGVYLLRIEDTDPERSKPEYTQAILQAFTWVNITSDEPLVIQSQRIERHKQVITEMLAQGTVYRCFCTPQELQERLGPSSVQEGGYTKYDQRCRLRAAHERDTERACVIRFKVPENIAHVAFNDLIHGQLLFDIGQFDDFVIMRSDGTPMYNFVVVVDDTDMGITHVLRGDDHIPNTPKQILLYQACGFTMPQFGHLPMILGSDGQRLSKRHAATSVLEYRDNGFLPDALCNYLVRLGWSHGDQEIFSRQELINYFSLEHVGKKGATFDIKKLEWVNNVYMRQKSAQELLEHSIQYIDSAFLEHVASWNKEQILTCIDLYKERTRTVRDLLDEIVCVYNGPHEFDKALLLTFKNEHTQQILTDIEPLLGVVNNFTSAVLNDTIKNFVMHNKHALADIAKPLRMALTGKTTSPGVFELLALLGKKESLKRLHAYISILKKAE